MNFAIRVEKTTMTLSLMGNLDSDAAAALRPTVESLVTDWHDALTIDLRLVRFLGGAGVGVVAFLAKRLGRRVSVINASGQPLDLLRHLGLDRVFGLPPAIRAPRGRRAVGGLVWGARAA